MGSVASKNHFQEVSDRLLTEDCPSEPENEFWTGFWGSVEQATAVQIYESLSPTTVRALSKERPKNAIILFEQAAVRLESVIKDPKGISPNEQEKIAMGTVRLLTRLFPFFLEDYYDPLSKEVDPFLHSLFWGEPEEEGVKVAQEALGYRLSSSVMQLLTLPPICVDIRVHDTYVNYVSEEKEMGELDRSTTSEEEGNMDVFFDPRASVLEVKYKFLCWAHGLKVVKGQWLPLSSTLENNRVEVLQLFIVMLSEPMFLKGDECSQAPMPFSQAIMAFNSPRAPELFKSIQALIVILDQGSSPISVDVLTGSKEEPIMHHEAPKPGEHGYNIFRDILLRNITTEADFKFTYDGLARLMNNLWQCRNSYVAGTLQSVPFHQELLVITWKLLNENPEFLNYVIRSTANDSNKLVVPLCYLLMENRNASSRTGIIHICVFILLKLSSHRNFCVGLNEAFTEHLPVEISPFVGSHIDLIIVVLHKLMITRNLHVEGLYNWFLTIICNISPFTCKLSQVASMKLFNLFEIFSVPSFICAAPENYQCASILLETFNNVIQHQYHGSGHLIYIIIREKEAFTTFRNLLDHILKLATEQIEEQPSETTSIVDEETTTITEPTTQTRVEETHLQQSDTALPNDEEAKSPGTANHLSIAVSADDDHESSEPSDDVPIGFQFTPSQKWVNEIQSSIDLNTIQALLAVLAPQVDRLCESKNIDEATIASFINGTTLVGLLPMSREINIRAHAPNKWTNVWISAFVWSCIFRGTRQLPVFDVERIRIFEMTLGHGPRESNVEEVLVVSISVETMVFFFSRLKNPASVSMEETIFAVAALAAVLLPHIFPYVACVTALATGAIILNSSSFAQKEKLSPHYKQRPSFITHFRGIIILLTCTAIFAVDFKAFPERFHKTNFYGTSLMDVGAGMIIFGGGVVEGCRQRKQSQLKIFSGSQFVNQMIVLILGLARLLFVKYLNYYQDVKEYGVYWNFFLTLWAVMWTTSLIRRVVPEKVCILVAVAGLILYEVALQRWGLEAYMFYAKRENLLSKNREGIFSIIGYTTLSFLGEDVARRSIREPLTRDGSAREITLWLFAKGYLMLLAANAFHDCISRRLTNASFVLWIGGHSTICLCCVALFDALSTSSDVYTSPCLSFISSHQMLVFLVANVIVGVTNMSINIKGQDTVTSIVILIIYMLVVVKSARFISACKVVISRYRNNRESIQRSRLMSAEKLPAP